MAVTYHTLTGDPTDIAGLNLPQDGVTGAFLETNLAKDQALVADGVRLPGVIKVDIQPNGTFEVSDLVASDSADTNLDPDTPLLYRLTIQYKRPVINRQVTASTVGIPTWSTQWFELNGSGTTTLADVVEVAYLPASLISQATASLEAARDEAISEVAALVDQAEQVTGIENTDEAMAYNAEFGTAFPAKLNEAIGDQVPGAISAALADPEVDERVTDAVNAAAAGLALQQRVRWGPLSSLAPVTATTLSGTPAYAAGKFSGARINVPTTVPSDQGCNVNGCFEARVSLSADPGAARYFLSMDGMVSLGYNAGNVRAILHSASANLDGGIFPVNGTEVHIALELAAGVPYLYLNGAQVATRAAVSPAASSNFTIGGRFSGTTTIWPGLINEVRVTRGVRYGGAFTPPAAPFEADDATVLLAHLNDASVGVRSSSGEGYVVGGGLDPSGWYHFYGPEAPTGDLFVGGVLPDDNDWTLVA